MKIRSQSWGIPIIGIVIAFTFMIGCRPDRHLTDHPNIIFILADDLGYGDLECYNDSCKIKTPNLNQLAEKGIRFSDAHTTSSVCTPTRYSILTGRYNWRSPLKKGVLNGFSTALIKPDQLTVAELLKNEGYTTACLGKWHLGWEWAYDKNGNVDYAEPVSHSVNDQGFDYSFVIPASLDMAPYVYVENGLATEVPSQKTENRNSYGFWREGLTAPDFYHDSVLHEIVERSILYINQQAKRHQPFFLYLPFTAPHTPILPEDEWKGRSGLNPYADFVMMVDAYTGKVIKAVEEAGIEQNTVIFFVSDNGCSPAANYEVLLEHGHDPSYRFRGTKSDIFEGGHRVPFIVKWPGHIAPNQVCNVTISTVDFMATCADLTQASLSIDAGVDSYSIVSLFDPETRHLYERKATVTHSIDGIFAITRDNWKMIFGPGSGGWSYPRLDDPVLSTLPEYQLYYLSEDISEKKNLIDSLPGKAAELKKEMQLLLHDGRSTRGDPLKNDEPIQNKNWWQIQAIEKD